MLSEIRKTESIAEGNANLDTIKSLTREFSALAFNHGISLTSYNDNACMKFLSLPVVHQNGIITAFRHYKDQCVRADAQNISLSEDNRKHAWWALKDLNLRAPDGLFEELEKNDIIEIYNDQSVQVFRSFNMFQYLSYSLLDIFSYEWSELYTRDEFVLRRMTEIGTKILNGSVQGVVRPGWPDHAVEETFSVGRNRAVMHHRLIAPVFSIGTRGSAGGIVSAFQIKSFESKVKDSNRNGRSHESEQRTVLEVR